MGDKIEDKSNSELVSTAKQMQLDYEAIKMRILRDLDQMDDMEAKFNKIVKELKKRKVEIS